MALVVKTPSAKIGDKRDVGLIPGSGRSPGVGNAPHSRVLAWKIPWKVESDGLEYVAVSVG